MGRKCNPKEAACPTISFSSKEQYASYIYINFYRNPEHKEIFEGSLEAREIYKRISLYVKDVRFIPHNTLIFLDEIQDCPNARTALKFLALDDQYDIISSGSLPGLHYKEMASIPVGYERTLEMFSLDFEEFLWASGKPPQAISAMKEYFEKKEKIPDGIHEQFLSLLREYLVVGGMPEVLNVFLRSNNSLNYFKNDKNTQEIEFIYAAEGRVIPIEVKSKRGATVSLNNFIEEYVPPYAYKLIAGNIGVSGSKITLPLYMAMFL